MARSMSVRSPRGFTLIEILVAMAIVGILSSVVLTSINAARNRARATFSASQVREIMKATAEYINDTGQYPQSCRLDCTSNTDPFINSLGIVGWNGPYLAGGLWNRKHPWGGHIGIETTLDLDNDGKLDTAVVLDDDAPGTDTSNNGGLMPTSALEQIDKYLDDGNLATGNARGNGASFQNGTVAANGELISWFVF